MAITNSCAAGGQVTAPTTNQNTYIITHLETDFRFPPPEDLSVAITNSCAAGGEVPRTKNQSKYIHYNSPGDRFYIHTDRKFLSNYSLLSNNTQIAYYGLLEYSFLFFFKPCHLLARFLRMEHNNFQCYGW